jgi:hypothetical protein
LTPRLKLPGQTYIKTITPPDKGTQLYGEEKEDALDMLYALITDENMVQNGTRKKDDNVLPYKRKSVS